MRALASSGAIPWVFRDICVRLPAAAPFYSIRQGPRSYGHAPATGSEFAFARARTFHGSVCAGTRPGKAGAARTGRRQLACPRVGDRRCAAWIDGGESVACPSTTSGTRTPIIYCLDVEKYQDANGDGIGDFEGLMRRLDYLAGPRRHLRLAPAVLSVAEPRQRLRRQRLLRRPRPKHGSLGDFVEFMNHADALGIRVIVDLVVNHTSDRLARGSSRRAPTRSRLYRDWYVWADERPEESQRGHRLSRASRRRPGRSTTGRASTTSTASTITSRT